MDALQEIYNRFLKEKNDAYDAYIEAKDKADEASAILIVADRRRLETRDHFDSIANAFEVVEKLVDKP